MLPEPAPAAAESDLQRVQLPATAANQELIQLRSLRQFIKRVLPEPVVDWIRALVMGSPRQPLRSLMPEFQKPEFGPSAAAIGDLENQLFLSGDRQHVRALEEAVGRKSSGSIGRARGELALARWDLNEGDPERALDRLHATTSSDDDIQVDIDLLRVDCLLTLGEARQALSVLARLRGRGTSDHNLLLRVGYARSLVHTDEEHGSGPAIEALNRLYHHTGLALVRRDSVVEPVGVDNLACDAGDLAKAEDVPMISVLVTVGADSLEWDGGVRSILGQTWPNSEILLLGRSALSSATSGINSDPRLSEIDVGGPIGERLQHGLSLARGDLVTIHRANTWAHPQRLERQAIATLSAWGSRGTVVSGLGVNRALQPCLNSCPPGGNLVASDPWSVMVPVRDRDPKITMTDIESLRSWAVSGGVESSDGISVAIVDESAPLNLIVEGPSATRETNS